MKSREELLAEIREIAAGVRELRRAMENSLHPRTRDTRVLSTGKPSDPGAVADGPSRRARTTSLAKRLPRLKR